MRRITAVAVLALLAGALAPAAGGAALDLQRPEGTARYRMTQSVHSPDGTVTSVVLFDLIKDDKDETVVIHRATRREGPLEPERDYGLDTACRRSFGGDGEVLAAFAMDDVGDLDALVPLCVPDDLFVSIADLINFLVIQSGEPFGLQKLSRPGDETRFDAFQVLWHRPPGFVEGRIDCPGGVTRLDKVEGHRAYVRWLPDPLEISMVRSVKAGDREMRLLLGGDERVGFEVAIDTRDGSLLFGRTTHDDIDLQIWMPFQGDKAPGKARWPETESRKRHTKRALTLDRIR